MNSNKKTIKDKIRNYGILNVPITNLLEIDDLKPIFFSHLENHVIDKLNLKNLYLSMNDIKKNNLESLIFTEVQDLEDNLLIYKEYKLNRKYNFTCPYCGSKKTLKIVYGYPTPAIENLDVKHNVKIGGNIKRGKIKENGKYFLNNRYCENCGNEFSSNNRNDIKKWLQVTKDEYMNKAKAMGISIDQIEFDIKYHEEKDLSYFYEQLTV